MAEHSNKTTTKKTFDCLYLGVNIVDWTTKNFDLLVAVNEKSGTNMSPNVFAEYS